MDTLAIRARIFFRIFLLLLVGCHGCADIEHDDASSLTKPKDCEAGAFRYPTTAEEFAQAYQGRAFYADGNHLGYDNKLLEGTPVHPIACGVVRVYRKASGYGTLVGVLEHFLPEPVIVTDGEGRATTISRFQSIYGHLRATADMEGQNPLPWQDGSWVSLKDVLGFVQNDALNGDGAEHLHLGIRLQSMNDAIATDSNWFRGYDAVPSQKRWFADPVIFLREMMEQTNPARWHPNGTLLKDVAQNEYWMLENGRKRRVSMNDLKVDRLAAFAVSASRAELACYQEAADWSPRLARSRLVKFSDASTVYEYSTSAPLERFAFVSEQTFSSWGWTNRDIVERPPQERADFLTRYTDRGLRRMRSGSLIKGRGQSEVCAVSDNRRLPIFDWSTFLMLGYRAEHIVEADPAVLDDIAYPRGFTITPDHAKICYDPPEPECVEGNCETPPDLGVAPDLITVKDLDTSTDFYAPQDLSMPKDHPKPQEACNGLDDDSNGQIDEIFLCPLGKLGPICVTHCGASGYRLCEAPRCDWSQTCYPFPENCDNTIDDDCDGLTDCRDPDCRGQIVCLPKVADAGTPPDLGLPPDLGRPAPMNRRLYIEAGATLLKSCQAGLVVMVWDPQGQPIRSNPGKPLDIMITPDWAGWAMMSTTCNGAYHGTWGPFQGSAKDAGFASVRLDGAELVATSHMVCTDLFGGQNDIKIAIPMDAQNQGRCP